MNRIFEFLQESTGKFSSNRLISILLALTSIFIGIWLVVHGIISTEYNLLIGILISGAVGNKAVGNLKKDK